MGPLVPVCPLAGGHSDCFHFLAVLKNAAMSIRVHVSLGVAGSYGNPVFNLMLRNYQTIIQSGRITVFSHWRWMKVLIPLSPYLSF